MLYQITDGTVSAGGHVILSHVNFEIKGNEKIALVGRNGAGKTTLLKLIAGELSLDRDDRRQGAGVTSSRRLTVGMLKQQAFSDREQTVEEILLAACPFRDTFAQERFEYEQEYDRIFTGFGFARADKHKKIGDFSGGEQTKIALIRLLLEKPDILLLDEPTNHLDIATIQWLEQYLKWYEHAVVLVSHDRFFLDQVAEAVVEVSDGKLTRYAGNYSEYRTEKRKRIERQQKAWERQKEEEDRLNGVIERFRHKPTKASFARAKKKQLERMERVEKPVEDDVHLFTGNIEPLIPGSKWVFEAEHLKIGFFSERHSLFEKRKRNEVLKDLSFTMEKGEVLGLVGESGCGKSTLAKVILGLLKPDSGTVIVSGNRPQMVFQDPYGSLNPAKKIGWIMEEPLRIQRKLPGKERRQKVLEMLKKVGLDEKIADRYPNQLSGGQRQRVCIGEALMTNPGLLVADEAVSALDVTIQAQILELLEQLKEEMGLSILFISHDMRVVYQLCDRVMIMKDGTIVESGDVDTVYFSPQHEYTKELLEAAGIGEDEA